MKTATAVRALLWLALLTLVIAAAAILSPMPGRDPKLRKQSLSLSNLKAIGTGIALHKAANRQVPPPDLKVLVAEGMISEETLISPLSGLEAYVYIRLPDSASSLLILAYEDPATHREQKTVVLFADFHGQRMPVDDKFWELVKQSKAEALPEESPTTREADLQTKAGGTQ